MREYLWSFPMLLLLLGTHLYFTVKLSFIQKWIPRGIRFCFSKSQTQEIGISPYGALATALAATIGTGNIIGISAAIALGGPGAVFWCWLTGLLGIATCYCECFLSVKYRVKTKMGTYLGGPMYVLKYGLHKNGLALLFSIFAVLASFGIGSSVQANSICTTITSHTNISPHLVGIAVAVIAGFVMLGGVKQISKVCTFLVPFMSIFYFAGCFYLLCLNHAFLLKALGVIITSAFSSQSLIGGIAGTGIIVGMRTGISKGLFTNEAGLGSIPMTAAAARTSSPFTQGLISMTGPFWDTVVMCAITGLVIVSSMLKSPSFYQNVAPNHLCFIAFSALPFGGYEILSISLILFAFATIIGWCYYGECSVRFILGERGIPAYQLLYILFIYLGAVMSLDLVWGISDLLNLLMALPNLFCIWMLRKTIIQETPH
ncbi:MAG: alanine/glycine:cation symporter family protein [Lachnospiraceae bacterium]